MGAKEVQKVQAEEERTGMEMAQECLSKQSESISSLAVWCSSVVSSLWKSRMSREVQVRFCEKLGVKFPRLTRRVPRAKLVAQNINMRKHKSICQGGISVTVCEMAGSGELDGLPEMVLREQSLNHPSVLSGNPDGAERKGKGFLKRI